MGYINKFEDIKAWKKARQLVKEIYFISSIGNFNKDFALKEQIRRSAISVVSNIAEGFGRETNKEFMRFLYISNGSLSEIKTQLYIASDLHYIEEKRFVNLYNLCSEISKIVIGFIKYLSAS